MQGEQLQHAIRAKLRRLAPQQQRLREDVLQEREVLTKVGGCSAGLAGRGSARGQLRQAAAVALRGEVA